MCRPSSGSDERERTHDARLQQRLNALGAPGNPAEMNLSQRIRNGVAWMMFGSTGNQIVQFLFGIALARLLVPADFGMIATIQILTGIVGLAASGGMGQSLIRAKQADEDDFKVVFTMQLAVGVLICAGIFVVAPSFARFFENPLYVDLLVISALNFLLRPFAVVRSAWLNREMNYKALALTTLVTGLVTGLTSIALALAGFGVWGLSLSGLIAALTTNMLLYRLTPLRLTLSFDRAVARRHASFGANLTAIAAISNFGDQSKTLIMSKVAGPEFLGLFNKAESLARMPNRIVTPSTGRVVFRVLGSLSNDLDQSRYIVYRTITLLAVYVWPLLIIFMWIAEPLIALLYGAKWLPAADPARIIALGSLFLVVLRPCSVLLEAQAKLGREMAISAISVLLGIGAIYLGLRWGLTGVAWAVVLSQVFTSSLTYLVAVNVLNGRYSDLARAVAPALILNAVMLTALVLAHWALAPIRPGHPYVYMAGVGAAGATCYAAALIFLPIKHLETEAARWRARVNFALAHMGFVRR